MPRHETELTRELITKPLRQEYPKLWIKKMPGGTFSLGIPDLFLCLDGTAGTIEVKKRSNNGGKPSVNQVTNLMEVHEALGLALTMVFEDEEKDRAPYDIKVYSILERPNLLAERPRVLFYQIMKALPHARFAGGLKGLLEGSA